MSLSRITLIAATIMAAPVGLAVAQVPIESLSSTVIEGRVGEVFGSRFILEDDGGRVLVETQGDLPDGAVIGTDDQLVIVGTDTPNGFLANAISRDDGTELLGAPRPPSPAAAPASAAAAPSSAVAPEARAITQATPGAALDDAAALAAVEALGFTNVRLEERGRDHFEYDARDADGRRVEVEIARDGTLRKLDVEDDTRSGTVDLIALVPAAIGTLAKEAGMVALDEYEATSRHFKLDGYTADGHDLELEFALNGTLRKLDLDNDAAPGAVSVVSLLPAGVQAAIAERGIATVREFETGPRHYKVEGFTEVGREIEIEIGFDDRLGAISVDDGRNAMPQNYDEAALVASVEAAGYQIDRVEPKPRHVEVDAINPEGENVRLHVDFSGEVYRERLVREGF